MRGKNINLYISITIDLVDSQGFMPVASRHEGINLSCIRPSIISVGSTDVTGPQNLTGYLKKIQSGSFAVHLNFWLSITSTYRQ